MSVLLKWDPNVLALDIPEIDHQHERLISLMNQLYDRSLAGAPQSELGNILAALGDATTKHFANEERYMAQIGYPDLRRHQGIHANLLSQLGQHAESFKMTGELSDGFFNFLKLWLTAHIKGIDRKYAAHAHG